MEQNATLSLIDEKADGGLHTTVSCSYSANAKRSQNKSKRQSSSRRSEARVPSKIKRCEPKLSQLSISEINLNRLLFYFVQNRETNAFISYVKW